MTDYVIPPPLASSPVGTGGQRFSHQPRVLRGTQLRSARPRNG
jgi:hypothetical protein